MLLINYLLNNKGKVKDIGEILGYSIEVDEIIAK